MAKNRVELQDLKISKFASHETLCFQAHLIIDGFYVAIIENDGQGGCNKNTILGDGAEFMRNKILFGALKSHIEKKDPKGFEQMDHFVFDLIAAAS